MNTKTKALILSSALIILGIGMIGFAYAGHDMIPPTTPPPILPPIVVEVVSNGTGFTFSTAVQSSDTSRIGGIYAILPVKRILGEMDTFVNGKTDQLQTLKDIHDEIKKEYTDNSKLQSSEPRKMPNGIDYSPYYAEYAQKSITLRYIELSVSYILLDVERHGTAMSASFTKVIAGF